MTDPTTALHYTANGNFVNGVYAPGADGFNLADVGSVSELNALPPGVKGLVYLGLTNGADANFQATVSAFKNNPNLYGFYIADEPGGGLAANLKAESDWIHANVPGAKTFIIEQNLSSDTNPDFVYNPANTDIDLFGLDPYPIKASGVDYSIIPTAVSAAEGAGIPLADIVPVYQAFGGGGYSDWILPTPAQEQQNSLDMGIRGSSPRVRLCLQLGRPGRRHRTQRRSGPTSRIRRPQWRERDPGTGGPRFASRRLQRRRPFRHSVAEHERSGRDLGNERNQRDRRWLGWRQSWAELASDRNG